VKQLPFLHSNSRSHLDFHLVFHPREVIYPTSRLA
jgi:hypothetical protein